MIKYLVLIASICLAKSIVAADLDLSCAAIAQDISIRGLAKNKLCETCFDELTQSLKTPAQATVILANWVTTSSFTLQNILDIKDQADQNKVEILSDMSSQQTYKHPSWDKDGILMSFVFKGDNSSLLKFFQSLKNHESLAYFEILNEWVKKNRMAFVTLHARFENQRQEILSRGVIEAQDSLVLINDLDSKTFFALVSKNTYGDLGNAKEMSPVAMSDVLTNWAEYIGGGKFPLLISDTSRKQVVALSLADLSEIQIIRRTEHAQAEAMSQRLQLTEQKVPKVAQSTTEPKPTSKAKPKPKSEMKIVSIPVTLVLTARNKTFGPKGPAALTADRPAVQIRKRNQPYFVVFSPQYIRTADIEDIVANYVRVGEIQPDHPSVTNFRNFVKAYQASKLPDKLYFEGSVGALSTEKGLELFSDMSVAKTAIIIKQTADPASPTEFVFYPIPQPGQRFRVQQTSNIESGHFFLI